jgi:hypothetical protein
MKLDSIKVDDDLKARADLISGFNKSYLIDMWLQKSVEYFRGFFQTVFFLISAV